MSDYDRQRKLKQATEASATRRKAQEQGGPLAALLRMRPGRADIQSSKSAGSRYATPEGVREALERFLKDVRKALPNEHLDSVPQVRTKLELLCGNHHAEWLRIQQWLDGPALPDDPVDFARQVVPLLPKQIEVTLLARLQHRSIQAQKPSLYQQARERLTPKPPPKPLRPEPPSDQTSQERFEQGLKQLQEATGKKPPTVLGPYSADIAPLGRKLIEKSGKRQAPPSPRERPTYPEVEQGIRKLIRPDALVPTKTAHRLKRAEGAYDTAGPDEEELRRKALRDAREASEAVDAQEVARQLARQMVQAQQRGETKVQLQLGESYLKVRNRAAIHSELDRIARIVRNSLGRRANTIQLVEVYFGKQLAWIVRFAAPAQKAPKGH